MKTTLTYEIKKTETGKTAAQFLLEKGYSSRLLVAVRKTSESLLVNGEPVFTNYRLAHGEVLTVILPEMKCSDHIGAVPMKLSILFEDEHMMIIDKPAGMPVHPSQGNHDNTLANGVAWYFREKNLPFVFRAVNRLDRDTSGLVLLAKNMLSSCILSDMVSTHTIHREYSAVVCGKTEMSGTVDAPIARKDGSTIERIVDWERGDSAVTRYVRLAYNKDTDLSFLRLLLLTGRTHQIRVHMKSIGHPLPGDFLYCPDYRHIERQALHSAYLRFPHPVTGEILEFAAPLPADMKTLFPEMDYGCLSPFG